MTAPQTAQRTTKKLIVSKLQSDVHKSALIAPSLAILNYILSPDFLAVLPDKYSHLGYSIAVLLGIWFPQLVKKNVTST